MEGLTPRMTHESAEKLLQKYADMVFRIAFARLNHQQQAEDIMQDVFVRYIKKQPSLTDEEHEKAWLIRATINRVNSYLASAWFRRTLPLPSETLVAVAQPDDQARAVRAAVAQLPSLMRLIVYLYYYEGYPTKTIAQLMGKGESAVKTTLLRARQKLQKLLEETDDELF